MENIKKILFLSFDAYSSNNKFIESYSKKQTAFQYSFSEKLFC